MKGGKVGKGRIGGPEKGRGVGEEREGGRRRTSGQGV